MPVLTNEELMRRIQGNSVEAFGVLYDRLAPKAFRLALGVLNGDPEGAQDAVQEGFLSLWRSRDRYREEAGPVQAWTMGIVRNRSIDAVRRNAPHDRRRVPLEDHEDQLRMPGGVEATVVDQAAIQDLRTLIAALPATQREVIALAYYGQLSHSEIAQQLNLPAGTVKGRMRLGLVRLREYLT